MGSVLPRDVGDIDLSIESFVIAVVGDGDTVEAMACAALVTCGPSIGEIRSVAVSERARGLGLGRELVDYLVTQAGALELDHLFLLTRIPRFFERLGFRAINPEELPDSFLADLVHCQQRSLFNKFVMTRELSTVSAMPRISISQSDRRPDPFDRSRVSQENHAAAGSKVRVFVGSHSKAARTH